MRLSPKLQPASRLLLAPIPAGGERFCLATLVGTLGELSAHGASATLSLAMRLVWEAQCQGEPVAWLTGRKRCFFPPDALAGGVDLEGLAVVRVPRPDGLVKAADYLVRSGAFGLLVIDLGPEAPPGDRQLTRLLGLARAHQTAIVFLTQKPDEAPSLGALVSLRGAVRRSRLAPGEFACDLHGLKDKRHAPGWRHREVCRGPAGLR